MSLYPIPYLSSGDEAVYQGIPVISTRAFPVNSSSNDHVPPSAPLYEVTTTLPSKSSSKLARVYSSLTQRNNLVMLLSFLLMFTLLGLKLFIVSWLRLEYIVAIFHICMGIFSKDVLRSEWKFSMVASVLVFWLGDSIVTSLGLFKYVEPGLYTFGTIPSYMMFMWAICYVVAIHIAYETPGITALSPTVKGFTVLVIIFTAFELFEPYLKIWVWIDYPTIVPLVILYESLVGTGYVMLYKAKTRMALALAFGLPFCTVCVYIFGIGAAIIIVAEAAILGYLAFLDWDKSLREEIRNARNV